MAANICDNAPGAVKSMLGSNSMFILEIRVRPGECAHSPDYNQRVSARDTIAARARYYQLTNFSRAELDEF